MAILLRGTNRTNAKIKAKRALDKVRSPREALEAFQRLNTYRSMERNAQAEANGCTTGTYRYQKHLDRSDEYGRVADDWETVLGQWLRSQAGVPEE